MAEQDEWRSIKAQSKPALPVPPRVGAYHQGLSNSVEPSGATGQGGEVATVLVSTQQMRRLVKVKGPGECLFKAPVRYNKYHIHYSWKDRFSAY